LRLDWVAKAAQLPVVQGRCTSTTSGFTDHERPIGVKCKRYAQTASV
jgi:hypothetical protein